MLPSEALNMAISKLETAGFDAFLTANPDINVITKKRRPIAAVHPVSSTTDGLEGRIVKMLINIRLFYDGKFDETGSAAINELYGEKLKSLLDALTAQVQPDFQSPFVFTGLGSVQNAWLENDRQIWFCDYSFKTEVAF